MKEMVEREAEDFLEREGFKVVDRILIKEISQIKLTMRKIEFPWVMKASSKKIVHKAKEGAVILNIDNEKKAIDSFDKLSKINGFEQAMIQKMISGKEIIIGIKKTPEFNHVLMFGKGGGNVEKEKDISFRVIPLDKRNIDDMMSETKYFHEIKNEINVKEIKKVLEKIVKLTNKYPKLSELDINPLIVNKKSATIADSRIIIE